MTAFRFRDLPYSKTDSVADLDAPPKVTPRTPVRARPTVPARACYLSRRCYLRKRGKCDDLHCSIATAYLGCVAASATSATTNAGAEARQARAEEVRP